MKKLLLLSVLLAVSTLSITAQRVTITGTAPLVYDFQLGDYYDNIYLYGSITITRTATTQNFYTTTDLSPKSSSSTRRSSWDYLNTGVGVTFDDTQVYFQSSNAIIKMWGGEPSVTSSNVHAFRFTSTSGNTTTFNYYVKFRRNSWLNSGTYLLPLVFRVREEQFDGKSPNSNPVAELQHDIVVNVNKAITLSLSTTSINFPDLNTGNTASFSAGVLSNVRYRILVNSALGHGGFLRHEKYGDPIDPINEEVPYKLYLGGTDVTPSGSATTLVAALQSPTSGQQRDHNLSITIGTVDNFTAGDYNDTLSFTVEAQ